MCLIIHREQGSNVPNDVLSFNRTKNPDGFGISWRDRDGLHWEKFSPKDYEPFHSLLKSIDKNPDIEYTAHFRLATTGAPCQDLSHPFVYNDPDPEVGEVHVFHNGVISISADKGESDTSQFVKQVLAHLPSRWWTNNALAYLVKEAIGYSRLLIMTKDETIRMSGGSTWQKHGGIWYSTTPRPYSQTVGSKYQPTKYTPSSEMRDKYPHLTRQLESSTDSRFDDLEPEEDDESEMGWYHQGHWVEAVTQFEEDGDDIAGQCICSECNTVGDFYIIGGTTFIDVAHKSMDDDEPEEGTFYTPADLSPVDQKTMMEVMAN